MLNILKVIMGCWHAHLNQFVLKLLGRILQIIFQKMVSMLQLLSSCELSHLVVDLGKLLHL